MQRKLLDDQVRLKQQLLEEEKQQDKQVIFQLHSSVQSLFDHGKYLHNVDHDVVVPVHSSP